MAEKEFYVCVCECVCACGCLCMCVCEGGGFVYAKFTSACNLESVFVVQHTCMSISKKESRKELIRYMEITQAD